MSNQDDFAAGFVVSGMAPGADGNVYMGTGGYESCHGVTAEKWLTAAPPGPPQVITGPVNSPGLRA